MSQTAVLELSGQAETFLRTVDQDVVVYWIVRGGQEDIYLERFLARVSELNTRIEVEKTDPVLHPGILSQYTSGSVDQNSLIAVCGQKSKYIGYGEIYVRGSDEDSAVRLCAESALCAAIRSVTTQQTPSVCLLTGHGEQSLPERFTAQLTAQGYRLSTLDLLSSDGIPADFDCLLVCGAAQDLTEAELMQLTAYLQDGRAGFACSAGIWTNRRQTGTRCWPATACRRFPASWSRRRAAAMPTDIRIICCRRS